MTFKPFWNKKRQNVASMESAPPDEQRLRDWTDDLPDEQRDRIIETVAREVVKRRMETAAILFLEMHKPVSFLASQGMVMFSPFTAPFIGMENVKVASKLMEKQENLELLVRRIEELSVEQEPTKKTRKQRAGTEESTHAARG